MPTLYGWGGAPVGTITPIKDPQYAIGGHAIDPVVGALMDKQPSYNPFQNPTSRPINGVVAPRRAASPPWEWIIILLVVVYLVLWK